MAGNKHYLLMSKPKVYLIDDDGPTNVYHDIIIRQSGEFDSYQIFSSATEALQSLSSTLTYPDLIFLDINMPIMSGWDFLEELQNREKHQDVDPAVVLLTTSLSSRDLDKSENYKEIMQVLEKPLTPSKISLVLERLCN